jgi:hypothetical protein
VSDRRTNFQERRQYDEHTLNEHPPGERRQHDERRLTHRSSYQPKEAEAWRLEGRYGHENASLSLTEKLQAVSPEAWTQLACGGRYCVVGPFIGLEHAKTFSQKPQQHQDYEANFFQLRAARDYWFVEVSPDGQTKLVSVHD